MRLLAIKTQKQLHLRFSSCIPTLYEQFRRIFLKNKYFEYLLYKLGFEETIFDENLIQKRACATKQFRV